MYFTASMSGLAYQSCSTEARSPFANSNMEIKNFFNYTQSIFLVKLNYIKWMCTNSEGQNRFFDISMEGCNIFWYLDRGMQHINLGSSHVFDSTWDNGVLVKYVNAFNDQGNG